MIKTIIYVSPALCFPCDKRVTIRTAYFWSFLWPFYDIHCTDLIFGLMVAFYHRLSPCGHFCYFCHIAV